MNNDAKQMIPFQLGDVLKCKDGPDVGVVVRIIQSGDTSCYYFPVAVGDLVLRTGPGITRVTNRYDNWEIVPRKDQTYEQRWMSWSARGFTRFSERVPEEEERAVSAIMALLPEDIVDEVFGPWPDRLEDALHYLVKHLATVNTKIRAE